MAKNSANIEIPLGTGGNQAISEALPQNVFVLTGSGTLSSSIAVTITGSSVSPLEMRIQYRGSYALNGNNITIVGTVLTQEQATGGATDFVCTKLANGSWVVKPFDSSTIEAQQVDGVNIVTLTGAGGTTTLNPRTDYTTQELTGSGVLIGSYVYQATGGQNGDKFRVIYNGSFAATGSGITIFGYSLSDAEMLNGGVTVDIEHNGSGWTTKSVSQNPSLFTAGIYETIVIPVSFESGEQAANNITVNYDYEIVYASAWVTKAIAGTDDATITLYINLSAVTNGVITIPASSAIDTHVDCAPTGNNDGHPLNSLIGAWSDKTTAGGKAIVSLVLKRTT